jgi:hypothetical protein
MLLKQTTLAGIAAGRVTFVFRRWPRPRVRAGSTLRTSVGVVAVEAIERTTPRAIGEDDARRAGYGSRADLVADLARYGDGDVFRIRVRLAGPDPRIAFRRRTGWSTDELEPIESRLARMDGDRPWTSAVLRLIAARPGVRAGTLAAVVDLETQAFKVRVRRLKNLGLTESLEVGYRLSPRGRALLRRLRRSQRRANLSDRRMTAR